MEGVLLGSVLVLRYGALEPDCWNTKSVLENGPSGWTSMAEGADVERLSHVAGIVDAKGAVRSINMTSYESPDDVRSCSVHMCDGNGSHLVHFTVSALCVLKRRTFRVTGDWGVAGCRDRLLCCRRN